MKTHSRFSGSAVNIVRYFLVTVKTPEQELRTVTVQSQRSFGRRAAAV